MRRWSGVPFAATWLALLATGAQGATLMVPSQWPTINSALDQAVAGDTVLVAPGVYSQAETRFFGGSPISSMAFLVDGVALISEGGADVTVLDLRQVPWGTYAMFGTSLATGPTLVEGFTVQGPKPANSTGVLLEYLANVTIRACKFRSFDQASAGGAIVIGVSSDVHIVDCDFDTCWAPFGGAIYLGDVSGVVERCSFLDCHAPVLVTNNLGSQQESVDIRDCYFERSTSQVGGGGSIAVAGSVPYQSVSIADCLFVGSSAFGQGGAITAGGVHPTPIAVTGNTFIRCSVTTPGGGGGAVALVGAVNVVSGNTFIECAVPGGTNAGGSAVSMEAAPVELGNNVFLNCTGASAAENRTGNPAGIVSSCNVFWGNPDGDAAGFQLSASDRVIDPLFCDPGADDFTLSSDSPCLPANSSGCGQIGALAQGCGPVSVRALSWGAVKGRYR